MLHHTHETDATVDETVWDAGMLRIGASLTTDRGAIGGNIIRGNIKRISPANSGDMIMARSAHPIPHLPRRLPNAPTMHDMNSHANKSIAASRSRSLSTL